MIVFSIWQCSYFRLIGRSWCALTIIFTFNFHTALINSDSSADHIYYKPGSFIEYRRIRDQCEWITDHTIVARCRVNFSLPDGEGYISVARVGSFTTTGGVQSVGGGAKAHIPEPGSMLLRGFYTAVDPYTGDNIGYPPLHYHHQVSVRDDPPALPEPLKPHFPWLALAVKESEGTGFPSTASARQCFPAHRGPDCYSVGLPSGYGRRMNEVSARSFHFFKMQDVRGKGSPEMSFFVDFGEVYLTKQGPKQPPLKPVIDVAFHIGRRAGSNTYDLQYNTTMLQYITYYFPTRTKLVMMRTHSHPIPGDEMWLIRGTQDDAGIPKHLQRPPFVKAQPGSYGATGDPMILPDGDIEEAKKRIESNIAAAHRRFRQTQKGSRGLKTTGRSVGVKSIKGVPIRPYHTNITTVSRAAPEILCKYYARVERHTKESIARYKEETVNRFQDLGFIGSDYLQRKSFSTPHSGDALQGRQPIKPTAKSPPAAKSPLAAKSSPAAKVSPAAIGTEVSSESRYNSKYVPPVSSGVRAKNKLVPVEDQVYGLTTGILPGEYYRRSVSSRELGDDRYRHCNAVSVDAGEFLTLLHFMAPRLQRSSYSWQLEGEREWHDHMPFVMHQRTLLEGAAHLPDVPFI